MSLAYLLCFAYRALCPARPAFHFWATSPALVAHALFATTSQRSCGSVISLANSSHHGRLSDHLECLEPMWSSPAERSDTQNALCVLVRKIVLLFLLARLLPLEVSPYLMGKHALV